MRIDRGLVFALGVAAVTTSACTGGTGTGGAAGPAPRASAGSLPQVPCSSGNLVATPFATSAQGFINRTLITQGAARAPLFQQALGQAQQGIAADAQNPYHYFLAGQAYAGMDDLAGADSMFDRAVEICPEFANEVNPERERAWAQAYEAGLQAYSQGDTARALATWESAGRIYNRRANAFYNLGVVYTQRGDVEKAIANYREALAALDRTPEDTAQALIQEEAETRASIVQGLFAAGTQHFQNDQFQQAVQVFSMLNELAPTNRDAWYNHALALYKLERWNDLVPVATRLVAIDPLNYNGRIILFNAYKGISDAAKAANQASVETQNRTLALRTLEGAEGLPVQVEGIQMDNQEGTVRITGTVKGAAAAAGTPIQLEFTLFGLEGEVGRRTVTVNAPAKDATANFELTVETTSQAVGYSYRQL